MGAMTSEQPWLGALRARGRARFEALGLPSTKAEAWRYFPTRSLRGVDLGAGRPAGGAPDRLEAIDPARVAAARLPGTVACAVFVDGRFAAAASDLGELPAGVTIGSLAAALANDPERVRAHLGSVAPSEGAALVAANESWFADGLWVDVPANTAVAGPVQVLFLTTDAAGPATHPRNVVVMGRSAELTLVLGWSGPAGRAYATNAVTELVLGDNATLRLTNVEDEGAGATHVHHVQARQGRDSTLRTFALSLGGESARTSIRAELGASGASCHLDGLYLAAGAQRLDHYTEVDHQAPHTASNQYYAGVIDDKAVGSYLGVVFIREGAAKTDASQLNKNLLLAPGATANSKPQLEIDHDDVKASHGTTVGQLDDKALFYLLSRAIGPEEARGILTLAFAQDALSRLGDDAYAATLVHRVAAKLRAEAVLDAEAELAPGDDDDDDATPEGAE
ncbi:MAG: Fe-S cluster assembly protein SufD [Deltaproteobacteria bacterium HGW-Deltaproteobacteria-14]|nr:MAG: Fe-S cluster assembly protein SufD [Deltaproteobacteria bacterium HGW-Deltaproteobacteria-14]